ncbi:peptidase [Burkholderia metallica]|uniref:peptidase n=1 Tax=Burkholderia metallica TaxID=488729 RepID=UPI001453E3F0|nr:peptidase [Burkholderia metallica]VWB91525.1 peptidase [Burkholderia metallica]
MSFRPGTIRSPSEAERSVSGLSRIELDPQQDRHARAALEAYADSAAAEMPWLAEWLDERLRDAAQREGSGPTYCGATIERVFDLAHAWATSQPDYAATAWERVRGQLQRMLAQPARPERLSPHVPADDVAEPATGVARVD